MKTSPNTKRLASLEEAAEYASVSTKTIRRRVSDGTLVGYRMGTRIIRVDLNDIDAMLRPVPTTARQER